MGENKVDVKEVPISSMSENEIQEFIKKNSLALKVDECKEIVKLIGRNPTLTEIHMFNIEWSEHCSYKSSRETLKLLPTEGPTVIQGPKEDAGIIKFAKVDGEQYGITHNQLLYSDIVVSKVQSVIRNQAITKISD